MNQKEICIIFNPTARGSRAQRFREWLHRLEGVALFPTEYAGHATQLAFEAVQKGYTTIVAAGGDGTVSEIVAGLAKDASILDRTRLGIIPLGTINVFAKELQIPEQLDAAWQVIEEGQIRQVDLPVLEARSKEGQPFHRAFVQLGGAGVDSMAIAYLSWRLKTWIGPFAYAVAGLQALCTRGIRVQVRFPSGETDQGRLVLFGNGERYGGDLSMFPGADMTDGQLDVRVFRRLGPMEFLRFAYAWCFRKPFQSASSRLVRASEFRLESHRPLPIEVDGDNVGWLPARIWVEPRRLSVIVPKNATARKSTKDKKRH